MPIEERRGGVAHDNVSGRSRLEQPRQRRFFDTPRFCFDPDMLIRLSDGDSRDVEADLDPELLGLARASTLGDPLHGQGSMGGAPWGVLEPERSLHPGWAELVDVAAETLDLVDEKLKHAAQGRERASFPWPCQGRAKEGDVAAFPP